MSKAPKVFRRQSDIGHASVFKSRMVADMVSIEIESQLHHGSRVTTMLSKEDARSFAEWLLTKCAVPIGSSK